MEGRDNDDCGVTGGRTGRDAPPGYEDPVLGWLPASARGQSCALRRGAPVSWLHPLAPDRVQFDVYGKGHTLPTFWTLGERCEQLYAANADERLIDLMQRATEDATDWPRERVDEVLRKPLAAFRFADLGARRFGEGAPSAE